MYNERNGLHFLSGGELGHKTAYKIKMQALRYSRKETWKLKWRCFKLIERNTYDDLDPFLLMIRIKKWNLIFFKCTKNAVWLYFNKWLLTKSRSNWIWLVQLPICLPMFLTNRVFHIMKIICLTFKKHLQLKKNLHTFVVIPYSRVIDVFD